LFIFLFFVFYLCLLDLPDICRKHCVNVAIASPEARAVARSTDETLAPTPAPAAAPQTMNTYRKEAKHSLMMDLQNGDRYNIRVRYRFNFSWGMSFHMIKVNIFQKLCYTTNCTQWQSCFSCSPSPPTAAFAMSIKETVPKPNPNPKLPGEAAAAAVTIAGGRRRRRRVAGHRHSKLKAYKRLLLPTSP